MCVFCLFEYFRHVNVPQSYLLLFGAWQELIWTLLCLWVSVCWARCPGRSLCHTLSPSSWGPTWPPGSSSASTMVRFMTPRTCISFTCGYFHCRYVQIYIRGWIFVTRLHDTVDMINHLVFISKNVAVKSCDWGKDTATVRRRAGERIIL